MDTNTQTFELNPEIKLKIAELATALDRSKSWVAREALKYGLPILVQVERRMGGTKNE